VLGKTVTFLLQQDCVGAKVEKECAYAEGGKTPNASLKGCRHRENAGH
jgi:hypothetical protein